MPDSPIPTYKKIQTMFKNYNKQMRDIWESYNLINQYITIAHEAIRKDEMPTLNIQPLFICTTRTYNKVNTYGAITSLLNKANPRRALIAAISTFEDYLGDLLYLIYLDYPAKISQGNLNDVQASLHDIKLLNLILESTDKEEMISKLSEEKIRSMFYGNPVDFFVKDKGKLEFGDYFKTTCKDVMEQFQEVLALRNVLIHNGGRVDRKYLREVQKTSFRLNQVVPVDSTYLRASIELLEGLGAAASCLALKNIYKQDPRGSLLKSWNSFKIKTAMCSERTKR